MTLHESVIRMFWEISTLRQELLFPEKAEFVSSNPDVCHI